MKITIVGAGTAGSLASAYFKKIYPKWDIVQIHSGKIPTIGVGESLSPLTNAFFYDLGLSEEQWMPATGSQYKLMNKFEDWGDNDVNVGFSYNKPIDKFNKSFSTLQDMVNVSEDPYKLTDVYIDLFLQNKVNSFSETLNEFHNCVENNFVPFNNNKVQTLQELSYSYHINAEKFADWIYNNVSKPLGVKEIISTIVDVNLDQNGIPSVILENGETHYSDYWLDCSGFHRTLIGNLSTFKKYNHIKTNKAVVMPIGYSDSSENKVYTRTIRNDYGWQFKISLKDRQGTGIIFSDDYFNSEEIQQFLLQKENNHLASPKVLKWTPGRMNKPGVKNVYSIGLAAGFVEPMEANALAATVSNIKAASRSIKTNKPEDFCNTTNIFLDDAADFISVHYTLCQKGNNKFWKEMRILGKKYKHQELLLHKYNHLNNTIRAAQKNLTNFPQHMWLQIAQEFYESDISSFSKNTPQYLRDQVNLKTTMQV